jgi:hypothetical protein
VALAEQELNNQFESRGLNEVSFLPGYISNVYGGILTWVSSDTPSNHSHFSFAEVEPIQAAEQKNRQQTLQLILTQGRGMSVEEIKASNKQEVHPPMNFHKLQEQLHMFSVASSILFGELSVGVQCLKALANMMNQHKSIFKAKERLDKEFPAKFLLAVDTRNQIWLNNCKLAKHRDEVDDSIIDFRPLVNQVIFGSFHMVFPPTFSMKSPKASKTSGPEDTGKRRDADDDKRDKKRGKGNDNAHSLVKNEFPHGKICMAKHRQLHPEATSTFLNTMR